MMSKHESLILAFHNNVHSIAGGARAVEGLCNHHFPTTGHSVQNAECKSIPNVWNHLFLVLLKCSPRPKIDDVISTGPRERDCCCSGNESPHNFQRMWFVRFS
jgi:hypothetical protein